LRNRCYFYGIDPEYGLNEINEENAVRRACEGDPEAFSFIYERYVSRIYSYVYYRIGSEADAEDITSRVFYRAFGHIGNYVDKGVPFSAWLYRIAHNLIANWHRDSHRRKEVPLEDQIEMPGHADHPERYWKNRKKWSSCCMESGGCRQIASSY